MFRFRIAVGSLLKAGLPSGLGGLAGATPSGQRHAGEFRFHGAGRRHAQERRAQSDDSQVDGPEVLAQQGLHGPAPTQEQRRGQSDAAANPSDFDEL